jgi:hypothetical protein
MINLLRSSLVRWVIWLVLLLSFLIVRPRPFTFTFWAWAAVVVGAGLLQMRQARVEALAEREAFVQWSDRLAGLGAVRDVEDDGHLYEWLDPPQWQEVFAALEAMPANTRSLRSAILATHPEVLE